MQICGTTQLHPRSSDSGLTSLRIEIARFLIAGFTGIKPFPVPEDLALRISKKLV
jgi:hypothetical protein